MIGGAERDRTVDLLNAIQALSQLSYGPTRQVTTANAIGRSKFQRNPECSEGSLIGRSFAVCAAQDDADIIAAAP